MGQQNLALNPKDNKHIPTHSFLLGWILVCLAQLDGCQPWMRILGPKGRKWLSKVNGRTARGPRISRSKAEGRVTSPQARKERLCPHSPTPGSHAPASAPGQQVPLPGTPPFPNAFGTLLSIHSLAHLSPLQGIFPTLSAPSLTSGQAESTVPSSMLPKHRLPRPPPRLVASFCGGGSFLALVSQSFRAKSPSKSRSCA